MVKELAKMIDHSLLHPTMTDEDLKNIKKQSQFRDQISTIIKKVKPYIYSVQEVVSNNLRSD